jgi:transcriptional regulator with XRE-family HTH domain
MSDDGHARPEAIQTSAPDPLYKREEPTVWSGEDFKAAMERIGLSQRIVARLLGISKGKVYRLCKADRVDHVYRFAMYEVYRMSVAERGRILKHEEEREEAGD